MKRMKSVLIIEHSISLLRKHEDSQGQQLNQRSFSLTMLCMLYYLWHSSAFVRGSSLWIDVTVLL